MDIRQALNRIGWRFGGNGNKNPFPVNEKDLQAYNTIVKVVKEHQEQQFKQNELFAKLYIFVYMRFISKMETTVMDNEPRKALFKILERPIDRWVEDFRNEMNDSERYSSLKSAGVELDHPILGKELNDTQKKELSKTLKEVWDFETTRRCLEIEINNALNLNK